MNDRRTRRFKERRSMFPFGQLMLPVIGVVAIGLLVIGIKLFFFPSSDTSVVMVIPEKASEHSISKQPLSSPKTVSSSEGDTDIAQPVATSTKVEPVQSAKAQPVLAVPVTEKTTAAPRIEPSPEKTPAAVKADKKSPEPASVHKAKEVSPPKKQDIKSAWGVQIGAFTAKAAANSVLAKISAQGLVGELNQAQVNGKVFYRVRVPSGNSRESAITLAQKLKDKGYPTLIVPMDQ